MKRIVNQVLSIVPRPLPVGMTAFNLMVERVHELSGKFCTLDDAKFVLSTTIMRLDPDIASKSDRAFVRLLRNAAGKQIAGACFQDLKTKQAEAQAKAQEEAKQLAEATAQQAVASDEQETPTA